MTGEEENLTARGCPTTNEYSHQFSKWVWKYPTGEPKDQLILPHGGRTPPYIRDCKSFNVTDCRVGVWMCGCRFIGVGVYVLCINGIESHRTVRGGCISLISRYFLSVCLGHPQGHAQLLYKKSREFYEKTGSAALAVIPQRLRWGYPVSLFPSSPQARCWDVGSDATSAAPDGLLAVGQPPCTTLLAGRDAGVYTETARAAARRRSRGEGVSLLDLLPPRAPGQRAHVHHLEGRSI